MAVALVAMELATPAPTGTVFATFNTVSAGFTKNNFNLVVNLYRR